ncbi:hypothetical protein ACLOJK_005807 [Asimina triloba]
MCKGIKMIEGKRNLFALFVTCEAVLSGFDEVYGGYPWPGQCTLWSCLLTVFAPDCGHLLLMLYGAIVLSSVRLTHSMVLSFSMLIVLLQVHVEFDIDVLNYIALYGMIFCQVYALCGAIFRQAVNLLLEDHPVIVCTVLLLPFALPAFLNWPKEIHVVAVLYLPIFSLEACSARPEDMKLGDPYERLTYTFVKHALNRYYIDLRDSKDYGDVHALIMHAYNSQNAALRVDHLGFHKAVCILMGWNYAKVPDSSKAYQSLSANEATANKEDLIIWPPIVIIHNTNTGRRKDGRVEGLGNKEMDNKLKASFIPHLFVCQFADVIKVFLCKWKLMISLSISISIFMAGGMALSWLSMLLVWISSVLLVFLSRNFVMVEGSIVHVDCCDDIKEELGFTGGKSKSVYGRDGHTGITVVKFAGSHSGLKDAERLADYFEKENHGRSGWAHAQASKSGEEEEHNPNLVKVDEKTGEKNRIFYGYLGTSSDLDKVDFDIKKRAVIKSKRAEPGSVYSVLAGGLIRIRHQLHGPSCLNKHLWRSYLHRRRTSMEGFVLVFSSVAVSLKDKAQDDYDYVDLDHVFLRLRSESTLILSKV